MGVYIKTYFKKTKSGGTEVAKYSTRMDPVTYKTINEYYVNGKRTTKKAYQKKVKSLGKLKKLHIRIIMMSGKMGIYLI